MNKDAKAQFRANTGGEGVKTDHLPAVWPFYEHEHETEKDP